MNFLFLKSSNHYQENRIEKGKLMNVKFHIQKFKQLKRQVLIIGLKKLLTKTRKKQVLPCIPRIKLLI